VGMGAKRFGTWMAAAAVVAFMAGCATTPPQLPVELSSQAMASGGGRIGVAMKKLPQVDTYLPGAGCLLCLAAASVANSQLTAYAQKLPPEQLPQLKEDVAAALRAKGADVVVIADPLDVDALPTTGSKAPNTSTRNFGDLKTKYAIARLLVIEIDQLGFERTYSAYVPTSDPKAVLRGRGYIVNLTNNGYEWFAPVNLVRSAGGPWDEPPKFPGLTNAYYEVVERGRDAFLAPFGK